MHATLALTTSLLALAASVVGAPTSSVAVIAKRGCNPMPSKVDPSIRDIVYKTVLANGGNDHVMLATMSAAITESLVNNLDCGDLDSVGIFQQRTSQGWGSISQIMDPVHATESFLNVLIPLEKSHPNTDAGVLAQMVQNAAAGNQYTKNEAFAKELIAQAKASVGGSAPKPSSSSSKPAPKPTSSSTPAPKPTSSSAPAPAPSSTGTPETPINTAPAPPSDSDDDDDCDADDDNDDDEDCDDEDDSTTASAPAATATTAPSTPINVEPAPVSGACTKFYTPKTGDNCYKLAAKFGIKLAQLYALNPAIDAQCHNLQITQAYCVDPAAAPAS